MPRDVRRKATGIRFSRKQLSQLQEIWEHEVLSDIDFARGWTKSRDRNGGARDGAEERAESEADNEANEGDDEDEEDDEEDNDDDGDGDGDGDGDDGGDGDGGNDENGIGEEDDEGIEDENCWCVRPMLGIQLSSDSTDYGLRTTDYGLLSVRRSWEVLGSPILIVYRGSRTRLVEYDKQINQVILCCSQYIFHCTEQQEPGRRRGRNSI
jgi:hypothetical protein